MPESDRALRAEIADAIERIRAQLALLRSGPTIGGASDDRGVIADLERELADLEEARGRLGP